MVNGSGYDPDKVYKDSKVTNVVTSLEFVRRQEITCDIECDESRLISYLRVRHVLCSNPVLCYLAF